jgi:7-cyano-7-deazaguanine synthase in queuosine biosynthesis
MNVDIHVTSRVTLRNRFPTIAVEIPSFHICNVLDLSFDLLHHAFGQSDPMALDFLLIASIVYVLDKAVPRSSERDSWTRAFTVRFPVSDPRHWTLAKDSLEGGLTFLTGDEWSIAFRKRQEQAFALQESLGNHHSLLGGAAVGLFSGGLDSLVGTVSWLAANPTGKMVLIGHHDGTHTARDQSRLWELLEQTKYQGRTAFCGVRVRPLPPALARPGQHVKVAEEDPESTLRSRSFLFLALGVYAAHALGSHIPLLMPENGFIAVNIPLTPSRIGSCSTRTMHPYFLDKMRTLIGVLGFENGIENPLEDQTKGETLRNCRDRATLMRIAGQSVSCAHSSRRGGWLRRSAGNCGYCVPCLIRRAAFHQVGKDRGSDYGIDVCAGEIDMESRIASDLNAMLDCLHSVRTKSEIEERIQMTGPLGSRLEGSVELIQRGLDELRAFIRETGDKNLRRLAGVR